MLVNLSFYERNGRLYWILINEENTMYSVRWVDNYTPDRAVIRWHTPFREYTSICECILHNMLPEDVFINTFLEITEEEAKTIIMLYKGNYEI